ncbi:MAG: glycosyltransferase [Verrucomicrobiae bacterium]|nr:glycosyltransferase [Verrucomicrobiae bacterium]
MNVNDAKDSYDLCIVIPCYNESEVLPCLVKQLSEVICSWPMNVRILFVDDGSKDDTFSILSEVCQQQTAMGCIRLSRNFGHQSAVSAGLRYAVGQAVVVMDADLQDPLHVILQMAEKWKQGYDIVYGIRTNRKEGVMLRIAYKLFYRLLKRIANVDIPVDAGDFSLMDRKVVTHINKMPECHRFVRGLRGWVGFRQIGVPYERQVREAGSPKYTIKRLCALATDGIFSFSTVPLRIAIWTGITSAIMGFLLMSWAVCSYFFFQKTPPGWASIAVIMLFYGGIQMFMLGIAGEYIGRIYEEVKRRPNYIVGNSIGWIQDVHTPCDVV